MYIYIHNYWDISNTFLKKVQYTHISNKKLIHIYIYINSHSIITLKA